MSNVPSLSNLIKNINESVTLKIDSKAKELKSQGVDIISYAAGEPDFPTPGHIVQAAYKALEDPANFKYTQAIGLVKLREAISNKLLKDSGVKIPASDIVVTNGGKQAVYQAFQVILNPGDEIIVPAPYWTTYPEAIALTGAKQVSVFAGADQGYKVTIAQLEKAKTSSTKALLFCSPSNPTGAVYSAEETKAIGEWALANNLWVITDEIYQNLVYDGSECATSITVVVPELQKQTILVNGLAKSYSMTGWRVGWMAGPPEAMKLAANLQSHLCSNVNNIAQQAAIAALTGDQHAVKEMRDAFNRRRKLIVKELSKVNGFTVPVPEGAFYVYADVREHILQNINGKKITSSIDLAEFILDELKVAVVPGEAFGPSGYLRFSYALGDDALVAGVKRLQDFFGTK